MKYVTIEREYGSGGRAVAKRLSEEVGIPCYGREILESAASRLNIPVSQLERYEENTTNSFLYSVVMMGSIQSADPDMLMRDGHLFVAEQMAIRNLAANGPAIFLGHCASEALRGQKNVIKVFIKSSIEARKNRIIREYGIPAENVDSTIRRFDKKRSGYYMVNTAKKWHDLNNYDVVLDSSVLGVEGCMAALKGILLHNV